MRGAVAISIAIPQSSSSATFETAFPLRWGARALSAALKRGWPAVIICAIVLVSDGGICLDIWLKTH